jgi:dTDP-4-dehydrorhamnose reductase
MERLDLRDHGEVERLVRSVRPSVCYLPAALTNMDYAEQHPRECFEINVGGTLAVARSVARCGGVLVCFSTDHVFADSLHARKEDESTNPLSVYARSKVLAEQALAEVLPGRHLILRTSWVYGPDEQEKNFVYRVGRALATEEVITVASDQHGQPTFGPDLARAAVELAQCGARGTYHLVGPRVLTRLEWAKMIAESMEGKTELIAGRCTDELNQIAPRPRKVCLARRRVVDFLGYDPIQSPRLGLRAFDDGRVTV